jgi:RNA polymerase sigma factor (TIGR02999 family)
MLDSEEEVTQLLQDWSRGDPSALDRLIPMVFEDLRRMAANMFQRESGAHTLQPTALVSEVYLRLTGQNQPQWQNREQFFAVASMMMRRILVDHAKRRKAAKRGGGIASVPLDDTIAIPGMGNIDLVLAMDEALSRLSQFDPRQGRIVEMHQFIGLGHEEIAEVLGISETTVKREWRTARAWLYRELTKG